jgi:hypothetical protein
MIYGSAVFMSTQLQPHAKATVAGKPFQRLSVESKTVETVCRSFSWLHLAEATC